MSHGRTYSVRRLGRDDLAAYRVIRLAALRQHPEAFSSSFEEESQLDLEGFAHRVPEHPPGATIGGFDGPTLVAIAGLSVVPRLKTRHKGVVVGVYVDPAHRGTGLAGDIMLAVIAAGRRANLALLQLTVTAGNDPARRLYERFGFLSYGLERRALLVGDRYYDETLMALDLA